MLETGETFGQYVIGEELGRGGMGTVYKAHQPSLARYVAIKVLPEAMSRDEMFRERFIVEARSVAALRHPNILQIHDFGKRDGVMYLVLEYLDGGTLASQLGAPLPLDYVLQILTPIAGAIDYAHARGVAHRDVKPANILLAHDGTPVLSDFGLARIFTDAGQRLTLSGTAFGTPTYMAPEQAMGEDVGPAADRYALGVVAYEMLAGAVPFAGSTPVATLFAHVQAPLPPLRSKNPELPMALEGVFEKGLAKSPAARFRNARQLVDAIAAAGRGSAVAFVPSSASTAPLTQSAPPPASAPSASNPPIAEPVARPEAARSLAAVARSPRALIAGAIAAVVVIIAVAVVARPGTAGAIVGPPGAPASTLASTPASAARGALLWSATLDAAGSALSQKAGSPEGGVTVQTKAGGIEFAASRPGCCASITFAQALPANYVLEVDLRAFGSSDIQLSFVAHTEARGDYRIEADSGLGQVRASVGALPAPPAPGQAPAPPPPPRAAAPLDALRTGRQVTLAIRADRNDYVVFADGQELLVLRGDRAATSTALRFLASGRGGGLGITGVRLYALQ